jgi:hypothetical protein
MRPQPMLGTDNELHHLCWLSADNVSARTFNPISAMTTTPKLTTEASNSPGARSQLQSGKCYLATARKLLHRSIS